MASVSFRTCVGCRARVAKRELVRVTVGSDASGRPVAVPDPSGTAPGRGAHLHPMTGCYELATRRKAIGRALRVPAGLDGAAVGDYVAGLEAARTQVTTQVITQVTKSTDLTEDRADNREEGWSSSS